MKLLGNKGLLAGVKNGSGLPKSAGKLVLKGTQTDEGPMNKLLLLLLGKQLLLRLMQKAPLALSLLVELVTMLNELLDLSKALA